LALLVKLLSEPSGDGSGFLCLSNLLDLLLIITYLIQKDDIAMQKAEVETLEQLAKFSVQLSCSYCNQSNVTPIQLQQAKYFQM